MHTPRFIKNTYHYRSTENKKVPLTMPATHSYHLHDEAGTDALGSALARILQPGLAIYLHGDLGAGKTALTRAMLHAAGHEGHVKSPTYTLAEPYSIMLDACMVTLIHFDLYRMLDADEFLEAGFREYFSRENICIVEWPEKGEAVLPAPDIEIALHVHGHGRDVELRALSDKGLECLARLKFAPNL
ncbi:MAG: tRNA ((37)-N6)-threonylcarbamoyltransferase complex ATPase subunit type 1 TsaE [Herbaspirillum sp.]|jgi:tRNA threonylcarbamoyladenosine biosynthesis protein TsaE|nr:tRNA ((37)-N6)-threonylcarbamoyltransferase complex ATPase subunit type 1 TsaE [Herbaspirillum sp.]